MEREVKKITTKQSSLEVELKTYFTAGEKKAVDSVLYKELKANPVGAQASDVFSDVTVESMKAYEDEMVKQCVVSVGGNKENPYESLLDSHHKDYAEVLEVVRKIYSDQDFLAEKTT